MDLDLQADASNAQRKPAGDLPQDFLTAAFDLLPRLGFDPAEVPRLRDAINTVLQQRGVDRGPATAEYAQHMRGLLHRFAVDAVRRGMLDAQAGRLASAEASLSAGLAAQELLQNVDEQALARVGLGLAAKRRGDLPLAEEHYRRAADLAERAGNLGTQSAVHDNLGNLLAMMGQHRAARAEYELAVPYARAANDIQGEVSSLNNLGKLLGVLGETRRAREVLTEALRKAREHSLTGTVAGLLDNLSHLDVRAGNFDQAESRVVEAATIYHNSGQPYDEYVSLRNLARLYLRLRKFELAGETFDRAFDILSDLRAQVDVDRYLHYADTAKHMERQVLARVHERMVRLQTQGSSATPADDDEMLRGLGEQLYVGMSVYLGRKYLESGSQKLTRRQYQDALGDLKLALAAFRRLGDRLLEMPVLSDLGLLFVELGRPEEALPWLNQALRLAHEYGDIMREVNVLQNLFVLSAAHPESGLDELDLLLQANALLKIVPQALSSRTRAPDADAPAAGVSSAADRVPSSAVLHSLFVNNNLAGLCMQHHSYARAEQLQLEAIEASRDLARDDAPELTDRLLSRLANLYWMYDRRGRKEDARRTLAEMRTVVQTSPTPNGEMIAAWVAADAAYKDGDLEAAAFQITRALDLSERLRAWVPRGESRIGATQHQHPPIELGVLVRTKQDHRAEALALVERGRSRQMLELLGHVIPSPSDNVPADLVTRERTHFNTLNEASRQLAESMLPPAPAAPEVSSLFGAQERVETAQRELDAVWSQIATIDPRYVDLRRGTPIQYADLASMLAND